MARGGGNTTGIGDLADAIESDDALKSAAAPADSASMSSLPSIAQIEQAINMPAETWKGQCYAIACMMLKADLVKGRAVYGHWRGAIHQDSMFAARADQGFTGHGWIETDEGEIIDPTRWVFEAKDPYLFRSEPPLPDYAKACWCGHARDEHSGFMEGCDSCDECDLFDVCEEDRWMDDYDEGGMHLRHQMMHPLPESNPDSKQITIALDDPTLGMISSIMQSPFTGTDSIERVHWLAKQGPAGLGPVARPLYEALREANLIGLVPIDDQMKVLGGAPENH